MIRRLSSLGRSVRRELRVYRLIARHPRTPRFSKWCLAAGVGYAVLPFDLIPDVIPVLGQVDDALIIPGLILLGLWLVPSDVVEECRAAATKPPAAVDR
jgi:uncharacterized membrane protein YkvA (DUF1232 family)